MNHDHKALTIFCLKKKIYIYICDPVWQKGTYSLSNCVTSWAHTLKVLKDISLKFLQASLLCWWSLVWKMHCHRPLVKQVMSFQSQKSGKTISPFLSDRVTYVEPPALLTIKLKNIQYSLCWIKQAFIVPIANISKWGSYLGKIFSVSGWWVLVASLKQHWAGIASSIIIAVFNHDQA